MTNFELFDQNLSKVDSYLSSLSRSLSLVLEEFYQNVEACGVSAQTGKGFEHLISTFDKSKKEYYEVFYSEIEKRMNENKE